MKIYLFRNPEDISQQQFEEELLPALPDWRREQALLFKFPLGRVLCAKTFLLLQEGLRKDFGISEPITFDYLEHDKPVLHEYPNIHFNLSHCKKGALCVISEDGPVGCDIETIDRHFDDALIRYCCNDLEIEKIKSAQNPEAEFIKIFTIKEAVLKYSGQGLVDNLPEVLTPALLETLQIETVVEQDFVYTICRK